MTTTPITEDVARRIRVLLAERGRNQADLARALGPTYKGLKQTNLSNRMRGVHDFTLPELDAIASWLDVPITELFTVYDLGRQNSGWISHELLGTDPDLAPAA